MALKSPEEYHKQKKKRRWQGIRAFFAAFSLTLCLLGMGIGFLVADYNTRRVTFGEGSLRISIQKLDDGRLSVGTWGQEPAVYEISDDMRAWSGRIWSMLPARWRVSTWLSETERYYAPKLLSSFDDMVRQAQYKYTNLPPEK